MSMDRFPVGLEMDVSFPNFQVSLTLLSVTQLRFEIKEGPFARAEIVDVHVVPLGNSIFAVSWQEKDGATVTIAVAGVLLLATPLLLSRRNFTPPQDHQVVTTETKRAKRDGRRNQHKRDKTWISAGSVRQIGNSSHTPPSVIRRQAVGSALQRRALNYLNYAISFFLTPPTSLCSTDQRTSLSR